MVFYGKKVLPDSRKGLVRIGRVNWCLLFFFNVAALSCCLAEFLDEEEPDASTPFQVFEDMLEDNISSRNGNLIVPDLGAEVMSDVTSSSGPMKLEDLQRILSNIGGPRVQVIQMKTVLCLGFPVCFTSVHSESRPFRQQVDSLTYVLRTGQIDLSQFEINPSKCEWSVAPEHVG
ncbi:hypothetical protein NC651_039239 [Populus alba x Populus x berolinensis]|nr:hypothetical protein NC651_039239 [Populus alba x Populus x berolinensis]